MDELAKLLDAISGLLSAVLLPAVVLAIVWTFRDQVRDLINRTSQVSGKVGPVDISITARAAGALGAAMASKDGQGEPRDTGDAARQAAEIVSKVLTPQAIERARTTTILWVDDHPDNTLYTRQSLEAVGVAFEIATSTDEGLELARSQRFDMVISDMTRGDDKLAGYRLLDELRAAGIATPFILATGPATAKQRADARTRGALGQVSSPAEVFELVLNVLGRRGPASPP